jgi:uncharacterized protein YggE
MGKTNLDPQEIIMKQLSTTLNIVILATIVFSLLAFSQPGTEARAMQPAQASGNPDLCDPSRTVQVSGTAVVNVPPDRALIQLGVQSNGMTPSEVENANAVAIQRVLKALGRLGIPVKDMVTDRYIIEPVYESYDSLYIKGYRIYNIVAVTLREIDKISEVVVTALEAGANQVVNVELYTSELRKYRDQAREMAMEAASEKAQDLASAAGAETGCVLNINENTWSHYNGWWWYGSSRDLWTQNVVQNASPTGNTEPYPEEGPLTLGQISVRAEVSATFALK